MGKIAGIILIVVSIIVAGLFLIVATSRNLTGLESVLLQFVVLSIGLVGSYIFGRESAREAAKDLVKPHARSAFRRLLSLYKSLSRLAVALQSARSASPANPANVLVLDKLEAIVTEQIATADDALEDWRDIVPEELKELHTQLAGRQKVEEGQ